MKCSFIVCWGALLWSFPVATQAITLWPLMPEIRSQERSTAIYIDNNSHERKRFQLRVRSWRIENGQEYLDIQQKVLPSPAMLDIEPGQRQLVRLVYVAANAVPEYETEQSYRVIIDDISAEPESEGTQINVRMRYMLPLFLGSPLHANHDVEQQLNGDLIIEDDGALLRIHNRAKKHVRLSSVQLISAGERLEISNGLLGYILPGSTNYFRFEIKDLFQLRQFDDVFIEARQGRELLRFPVNVVRHAESGE